MKKLVYSIIVILILLIVADRVCKFYEKKMATSEIKESVAVNPALTSEQNKDYRGACTFRLIPYDVFGLKPGFKSNTVNINSLGLRGREITEKKESTYRIAILGGSAVFGGEVPSDNLTFSGLLENKLNASGQNDFEVINAGVPAYVSMQELILLEDKIISTDPNMTIIFDGFNDFLTVLKRDKRPNYPWWFSEIEKVYYTSVSKLFLEKKLKKYRPTKLLLNWIEKKKEKKVEYKVNEEQVAFYERNLDLMCHLAKSYGMGVVLVFQPVILYKNPLTKNEQEIINKLDPQYIKVLKEMCDLGKKAMEKVAIKNNVDFIDGTSFFNNVNETIFLDEVHFNQKGHDIVAVLLCDKVKSKIKGIAETVYKAPSQ